MTKPTGSLASWGMRKGSTEKPAISLGSPERI